MWKRETYCPRFTEIKPLPCPKPPPKNVLIDQVNQAIAQHFGDNSKCIQTSGHRSPTVKWLLDVLAVLNPAHVNFVKGFTHEKAPVVGEQLRLKVEYIRA